MFKIDWAPDDSRLRRFGWIGLGACPLIGIAASFFAPESERLGIWMVAGALALACGLMARFAPGRLKPLFLLVMFLVAVLLSPITLALRLTGRGDFDGNARKIREDAEQE